MLTTYRRFKKNTPLRKLASPGLVTGIKATEQAVYGIVRQFQPVLHQSKYRVICHIGLQKTGTVWFREMLSDIDIYKFTGLHFRDCSGKGLPEKNNLQGIYGPIRQFDDQTRKQLSQPDTAVIAVIRDPVTLVLSWLKSTMNYHVSGHGDAMSVRRQELALLDRRQQIAYALDFLKSKNRFQQFDNLIAFAKADPSHFLVKYEDCIHNPYETFRDLFETLDIRIDDTSLKAFIARHSFKAYTGRSIVESASPNSSMQGRTHIEADSLPNDLRELIIQSVGDDWAAEYGYR